MPLQGGGMELFMMNPAKLFKLKGAWETFSRNHPKFPQFVSAVQQNAIKEDSMIEINITTLEGKTLSTNLKLTQSDMDLFRELSEMSK